MNLTTLKGGTKPEQRFLETVTSEGRGQKCKYYDSRTEFFNGYYHVYPVAVTETQVYIYCPHCHKLHAHGNPGGDYAGHRVSHCSDGNVNNGYIICKL